MNESMSVSTQDASVGEPFIELPPGDVPWACNYRSTWVVSSLDGLRGSGYFDRYQAYLREHRSTILSCIAGTWLPMAVACEHYQACEQLGLTDDEYARVIKAGSQVRVQWNARVIAELKADGATPWDAMRQQLRTWKRTVDGGAYGVYKLGERHARTTYVGCELFDIPYFRRAVQRMGHIMCAYKGKDVRVQEIATRTHGSASYSITWK